MVGWVMSETREERERERERVDKRRRKERTVVTEELDVESGRRRFGCWRRRSRGGRSVVGGSSFFVLVGVGDLPSLLPLPVLVLLPGCFLGFRVVEGDVASFRCLF